MGKSLQCLFGAAGLVAVSVFGTQALAAETPECSGNVETAKLSQCITPGGMDNLIKAGYVRLLIGQAIKDRSVVKDKVWVSVFYNAASRKIVVFSRDNNVKTPILYFKGSNANLGYDQPNSNWALVSYDDPSLPSHTAALCRDILREPVVSLSDCGFVNDVILYYIKGGVIPVATASFKDGGHDYILTVLQAGGRAGGNVTFTTTDLSAGGVTVDVGLEVTGVAQEVKYRTDPSSMTKYSIASKKPSRVR